MKHQVEIQWGVFIRLTIFIREISKVFSVLVYLFFFFLCFPQNNIEVVCVNETLLSSNSSLLSHDLQVKLESTGKLLDDLQEAQNIRLSHRPEGPGGPTPGASIRPSAQEKIIGENFGITA